MLYVDIAQVYRDIAHVVIAIHLCFKCMFQMFHMFQTYVVSVLSECCKIRSGCCIYMLAASICFKVFSSVSYVCLQVFHLDVAYVCNGFQNIFRHFRKCFRRLFQVFHLSFLYVTIVASECFKSRSGVAHGIRVGG